MLACVCYSVHCAVWEACQCEGDVRARSQTCVHDNASHLVIVSDMLLLKLDAGMVCTIVPVSRAACRTVLPCTPRAPRQDGKVSIVIIMLHVW